MWDLDQIIRNNNQAAVEYMMRGQKADEVESSIPAAWTLERVAAKLRIGPPALSELMNCCMEFQKIEAFLELIRVYLPEHEEEILSQPRDQRLHRFCYLFGKRYFPLPASAAATDLGNFVVGMPVMLAGLSHNVYHDLELHPGYLLLLSLVVYPYAGCEMDDEFGFENKAKTQAEISNGPRIPLLDKVQNLVGAELAKRIPESGWDPEWLHQATDRTKHDGVGSFADWACSRTGCVVLDCSYADCSYIEGDGEPVFLWTRGNVDMLTEEVALVVVVPLLRPGLLLREQEGQELSEMAFHVVLHPRYDAVDCPSHLLHPGPFEAEKYHWLSWRFSIVCHLRLW